MKELLPTEAVFFMHPPNGAIAMKVSLPAKKVTICLFHSLYLCNTLLKHCIKRLNGFTRLVKLVLIKNKV